MSLIPDGLVLENSRQKQALNLKHYLTFKKKWRQALTWIKQITEIMKLRTFGKQCWWNWGCGRGFRISRLIILTVYKTSNDILNCKYSNLVIIKFLSKYINALFSRSGQLWNVTSSSSPPARKSSYTHYVLSSFPASASPSSPFHCKETNNFKFCAHMFLYKYNRSWDTQFPYILLELSCIYHPCKQDSWQIQ